MHCVIVIDPLRYFFEKPVMPDIVKRPLDRLPTTTVVILTDILSPSFDRAIPLRDQRLMYLVGVIDAASFI